MARARGLAFGSLLLFVLIISVVSNSPFIEATELHVAGLFPLSGSLATAGLERAAAAQMAVQAVNDAGLFHNGELLLLDVLDTESSPTDGYAVATSNQAQSALTLFGECWSEVSASIALLQRSQLAISSSATVLTGLGSPFPNFSRMVPSDSDGQVEALASLVSHFGWEGSVAAVATSDTYGAGLLAELQRTMGGSLRASALLEGNTYEQISILRSSGAHVFFALMLSDDFQNLLPMLDSAGLIGGDYVWLCSDGAAQMTSFIPADNNSTVSAELQSYGDGIIGTIPCGTGSGVLFNEFIDKWQQIYGAGTPNVYALHTYDGIFTLGYAFAHLLSLAPDPTTWSEQQIVESIRDVVFDGVSGYVKFNSVGDRLCDISIVNFSAQEGAFSTIGYWNVDDGLVLVNQPVFYGNSTAVPTFETVVQFDPTYWSCTQETELPNTLGIQLEDPAVAGQVENISMRYTCDQYPDCSNNSDEPISCGSGSITLWWIVCGIIASIGLVAAVSATIACVVPYVKWKLNQMEEERRPSPVATVAACVAVALASTAVYSSFGKPTDVSCAIRTLSFLSAVEIALGVVVCELVYVWVAARREEVFRLMQEGKRVEVAGKVPRVASYAVSLLIPCLLVVLWIIFGSPFASSRIGIDGKQHYQCSFNTASTVLFVGIAVDCLLKLCIGLAFSILLRRQLKFSLYQGSKQCRSAALALQNFLFWAAATLLIWLIGGDSETTAWVVKASLVLYITYSTLFIAVLPHLFAALGKNPIASALGVQEENVEMVDLQRDDPPMEDSFSLDYDRFLDDSNEEGMKAYSKLE